MRKPAWATGRAGTGAWPWYETAMIRRTGGPLPLLLATLLLALCVSCPRHGRAQPAAPSASTPVEAAPAPPAAPSQAQPAPAPEPDDEEDIDEAGERAGARAGDALTVYVLTMGPGNHPFFKFGHNAIWIHDERTQTDRVYNYGTFHFGSITLVPKFFLGRFLYSLSRGTLRSTMAAYRRENRTLVAQRLALSPDERVALRNFLEWNARPENRHYKYDYYRDNCTTRVRDAIDQVIGGQVRKTATGAATMTYRAHTLRLTADLLPEYVILLVVLGDLVDQPIDRWQEAFLPEKLQLLLREVTVPRPDGPERLVAEEKILLTAKRPPSPAQPPRWFGRFLATGAVLGLGLMALGRASQRSRAARVLAGISFALLGLLFGFLGTAFVLIWALTDHEVGYRNENILQLAPWLLALVVLGVGVARGRPRATRGALRLWQAAAAASVLGALCKLLPWFDQYNAPVIAFALPVTFGATISAGWLERIARARVGEAAAAAAPSAAPTPPEPPGAADDDEVV